MQAALAGIGTVLFMLYARSWRDLPHLVYDATTGLTASIFIAELVTQGVGGGVDGYWIARAAMVVALSVVTAGRIIRDWPVSGHVAFVLAIALVQVGDAQLPWFERLLYSTPVPVVLAIRWTTLDRSRHTPTYVATGFAAICAVIVRGVGGM